MENTEVTLRLTVAQVNTLLKHLGNGIYLEVNDIINQIRVQVVPQIAPPTVESDPE